MTENIRTLTHDEVDLSLELSQFAFQYELSSEKLEERKKRTKPEQIWGYFHNGQLASKMHIFPFKTFIQGKEFSMGGIAGVATWPEFRRQGMVEKLLVHGLHEMKRNGQSISMLHPFDFAFYRRYGWETYCEYKKYAIETHQLPHFKNVPGMIKRVGHDIELLQEMYEKYAVRYNGTLKRDTDWWTRSIFNQKYEVTVYYNVLNEPLAYIIYEVKKNEMSIDEYVYLNEEGRQGLWSFIKNHDSMIEKIFMNVPSDDQLPFLFSNPKIKQEIVPYFMARIVDVSAFLAQYPLIIEAGNESIFLHITDDYAPWNNGTYQLYVDQSGEVNVTTHQKSVENMQCAHPPKRGLMCDIQSLTTMLLGYQTPTFLFQAGRLKGNEAEVKMWEQLIPKKTTLLIDYF